MPKLNAFHLKVIALLFMFTEHLGRYLGDLLPPHWPLYLEYVGRLVAPIFFFLSVESFFKTNNRPRYLQRLYTWAIVMAVGNAVISAATKAMYQPERFFPVGQNIFLSIAVGVSMIAAAEWARQQQGGKRWAGIALALFFALASLLTEASYNGLAMYLVFYLFYHRGSLLYVAYAMLCALFLLWGLTNADYFWTFEFQWMMIIALPFLMLYDGKRGRNSLKYFFYGFYPLHIWILYLLSHALGLRP